MLDSVPYHRLFRSGMPGENQPTLTGLTLDSSVVASDGVLRLRFGFSDPDGDDLRISGS